MEPYICFQGISRAMSEMRNDNNKGQYNYPHKINQQFLTASTPPTCFLSESLSVQVFITHLDS